ncbi:TetR/AcrR family transcriptional regulator [Brachybacterium sp. NBEC-018]|uniref:TetR/AcrR family transcriptional regulator n=1 Tax=Brachybacterium sp. NBEC-018 TaxID=2996004 RepID=UPI0021754E7F|nr:TetR/AcrR family transcriptional regulator [Brachybacterium sp. NBEC-018]UVY82506.1 TetR/AcrR family transcriptional regulator [Brachybacterium sp. NBEC-018]
MEAVVTAAVALLDEAGEGALTFRALAVRLGGGVGSIYWYVSSKEELLDRAGDHVVGELLERVESFPRSDDPIADLRALAVAFFEVIVRRPWITAYFLRNTRLQPNDLALYERMGQEVMRLGMAPRETFHAISAVVGFVIGIAADLGQQLPREVVEGELSGPEYLEREVAAWRATDPEEYPFAHYVVDVVADHDDTEQFLAGLDLLLEGLRRQADRTP